MQERKHQDPISPYAFPTGNMTLLGMEHLMYQGPQERDAVLIERIAAANTAREATQPAQVDGFRNSRLAALVPQERFTASSQVRTIRDLLRDEGALNVHLRDAAIQSHGVRRDSRITGATDRATGDEMSQNVWIRDQTQNALASLNMALVDPLEYRNEAIAGRKVLSSVLTMMATAPQLDRFKQIIARRKDNEFVDDPHNWPHIFLKYDNLHSAKKEGWGHKQDAWQMAAWTTFHAIDNGLMSVQDLTPDQKEFLGLAAPFLLAVDFTNRENSGSWEEYEAVRTSTMAWETALLHKVETHMDEPGFEFLKEHFKAQRKHLPNRGGKGTVKEVVGQAVEKGLAALEERIPFESPDYPKDSVQHRKDDAAVLYLLDLNIPQLIAQRKFPAHEDEDMRASYELGLEGTIIKSVMELSDPATNGIKRYAGDRYQGAGFWTNTAQLQLDQLYKGPASDDDPKRVMHFAGREEIVPPGREAAWTHFNFQISSWASNRYMRTGNDMYLQVAEKFLKRGLSTVTGDNEFSVLSSDGQLVIQEIPAFRIPECYVTHTNPQSGDEYITPSPNTPLNWAISQAKVAIARMEAVLPTAA